MSFQGDVAGLGLGELLQGLARGGREGVLTLYGGGLSATLGVLSGQLHLLPEPDEDPETWRKRCGRAYPEEEDGRIDSMRMVDIAYAARLERMFELLDCEGVHFRFEPGPLPNSDPLATEPELSTEVEKPRAGRIAPKTHVYCSPISVEFLLLEHARLSDECTANGDSRGLSLHEVPCPLVDPRSLSGDKMFAECDGASNVVEISDRLSWPLRQTRAAVFARLASGHLRLANANELAALTRDELVQNRFQRAASRLAGWAHNATPGMPDQGEAELLIEEWNGGKLALALACMSDAETRTVLRRMELAEADPKASMARWREICKHHRHDMIAEMHLLRLGLALEDESQKPSFTELLKVARHFSDQGRLGRAGAMLVAAATRNPEGTQNRLELGNRLLACGLVEASTPWILEACRALLDAGLADKALGPLRALVTADPTNRDARSLFNVTRSRSTQGKAKTRNLWIALALVGVLGLGALVQLHADRAVEQRVAEMEASEQRPEVLLRVLHEEFPDNTNPRVLELRRRTVDLVRRREMQQREAWLSQYTECAAECNDGDPLLGLVRTLNMQKPPELEFVREPWPSVYDILQGLAGRLEQSVGELGHGTPTINSDNNDEKRLSMQVRDLIALGDSREKSEALEAFLVRLRHLLSTLHDRDEERAALISAAAAREIADRQEQLLGAARALSKEGDLERSALRYEELLERDEKGLLARALAPEIGALKEHLGAVSKARTLAAEGRHGEAVAELKKVCEQPWEHLLPWKITTVPTGGRARFADGSVKVAPCVIETAPGEKLDFTLELGGFETLNVHSDGPADMDVVLSRLPERWWRTDGRVEAPPVSVQEDHVLVDRHGSIVRLGAGGALRWQRDLESLSGFARAPLFLPTRPGTLLCLTEDGNAWLLDCADGKLEGPWEVGAPPLAGPSVDQAGVRARFSDGRELLWDTRLRPETMEKSADPAAGEADRGSDAGLSILRRRDASEGFKFKSQWTDWAISIQGEGYLVQEQSEEAYWFSVRRLGDWSYVAWEAPTARTPAGRLWIADGAGLRAFVP
ncbi:MAG: DUF4388 domain-containing protein [Planctomycetes bacterium]|nr:DUF4388 domain-containing protein [Planctomycetota bacterium]